MKVLFDSNVLTMAFLENVAMLKTGIYRYTENLAVHLKKIEGIRLSFYSMLDKTERELWQNQLRQLEMFQGIESVNFSHPLKIKIDQIKNEMMHTSKLRRFLLKTLKESYRAIQNTTPHLAGKLPQVDIFYSPYHPIPNRLKAKKDLTCVTMIHDLIPLKFPEFFKVDKRGFFDRILKKAGPADFFITPSQSTKADICHYYPIQPDKIFVVPGAVQSNLFYPVTDEVKKNNVLKKHGIEGPYLLSLATLEPRKNIITLIDAYIHILEKYPAFEHKLVLVGAQGWGLEKLREKIASYQDRILLSGFVEDSDLATIYSGATAFVYPSLYEGFGFPPLEAMQCQTPVIVSNRSSLPEVVQEAGLYVDPSSKEDIAERIIELIESPKQQSELKKKGLQQVSKFTWERCAQDTYEAFEKSLALTL